MVAGLFPLELYREFNPQASLTGLDSFCIIAGYDEEDKKLFLTDSFGLGYMPVSFENPENSLAKELEGKPPVIDIGDSGQPGKVKDAIEGGFIAGMEL